VTTLLKHTARVTGGAFSPDGRRVITASTDGTARVWDAATGEAVTPALFHGGVARGGSTHEHPQAAFTSDGDRVLVASWAGVRAWDLKPDPRPFAELDLQAQTTSGFTIDRTGAHVPLDPGTFRTAWEKLRK
jgi:WD40 repeat protein